MHGARLYARLCAIAVLVLAWCSLSAAQGSVANFIGTDKTTQGSWHGVYGGDGYSIAGDSESIPTYASFTVQNELNYTWNPSTTDPRALQRGSTSGSIAACWFTNDHLAIQTYDFDVNFTDANTHQFALYALDWDSSNRSETIQIVDAVTGNVLDTRTISNFVNGIYLVWNISGHVQINVTLAGGTNAATSGAFFGGATASGVSVSPQSLSLTANQTQQFAASLNGAPTQNVTWAINPSSVGSISSTGLYTAPSTVASAQTVTVTATNASNTNQFGTATINLTTAATANFVAYDTVTQGNWQGVYGADGYSIAQDSQSIPAYATFATQNGLGYTWTSSTSDPRALQTAENTGRIAACWFSSHFSLPQITTFDVDFTDGNAHQFALYFLDWDLSGRVEMLQVVDPTTKAVLDTRTLSSFSNGVYVVWTISGHVTINVTLVSGPNDVISAAFFGGGSGGGTGSISVGVSPKSVTLPAGQTQQFTAAVSGTANQNVNWSINPSGSGGISATGLYTAPATITSSQQVTVTATSQANTSKFGTATVNLSVAAVANFVGTDTSTQGNWHGMYGVDGYSVVNDSQIIPAYASFAVQNQTNYTWNPDPTDVRALQTGSDSGRIASAWYSANFSFDINITDGNLHQVALYFLDWDNGGRAETIKILDAASNAVLDTEKVSGFANGTYLLWNITGHVTINVTLTSGANAVVSGVFFGGGSSTALSVTPQSVSLTAGQSQQFAATIDGAPVPSVTWSINPGVGGISTSGLYTAPSPIANSQTVTVTATSGSASGGATVLLTAGAVATFVKTDATTQGNWQGAYGVGGYSIPNSTQSTPAYVTFTDQNGSPYTWSPNPSDQRALLTGNGSGRIASCWFNSTFSFDVNFTDGSSHQLELYALDWDNQGRAETIQIVDAASNAVLSSQKASNFGNGIYFVWNITGHVKINITLTGGPNAVISGMFFN